MAQYNPTVFGLLLTIAATAATAAACPAGWTPSPNASWANQCFGVPTNRSSSLRSCVELCGAEGGVPACIASAEENGFAAELLGNETAWLGLYQNDTSGGVDEGWGRCVAFEAPSFSNWSGGEPSDQRSWLAAEDCAVMYGRDGTWFSRFCAFLRPIEKIERLPWPAYRTIQGDKQRLTSYLASSACMVRVANHAPTQPST